MAGIDEDIAAIRNAVYGRDVREAIADGLEQAYHDVDQYMESVEEEADVIANMVTEDTTGLILKIS